MLTHPTTDRLRTLGLAGMARALEEQRRQPDAGELSFEDRLAMLVDREALERDTKRLATRLRFAGLRQQATPEDVDHHAARGLDRAVFQRLVNGNWIERHQDLLVTGPTGTGKTWLTCALGHRACRDNRSVLYHRWPKLCGDLALARGDGDVNLSDVHAAVSAARRSRASSRLAVLHDAVPFLPVDALVHDEGGLRRTVRAEMRRWGCLRSCGV